MGCLISHGWNMHSVFPVMLACLGGDLRVESRKDCVVETESGSKICSASRDFNL